MLKLGLKRSIIPVRRLQLLRFNSSTASFTQSDSPYEYIKDYPTLYEQIKTNITSNSDNDSILEAVRSIKLLQSKYPIHDQLEANSKLTTNSISIINLIFQNKNSLSPTLLKELFTLNLPTIINLKIINLYYELNPGSKTIIDKEVALIPLRNAIFNADFAKAIKITDTTVGHPNYILAKDKVMKSSILKLISTVVGITLFTKFGVTSLIDSGFLSPAWHHLGAINSILLTYIINTTFFVSIVKFGRTLISSGGDYLTWQHGTFYSHWFKHSDEMLFNSKIIESDRDLNNGESSPYIIEEICREAPETRSNRNILHAGYDRDGNKIRLMQQKDDLEKIKFQAYWMTGGDGFEWVEPDQDPAEIVWRNHLAKYNKPALEKSEVGELGWADELIDEKK
ncbi:hypothetical protein KGF54_004582 [Candida jiufengensis]|uniref:uncharacterized protein n=1 Tax=Candida jiufengensis TaxID=497108 RepID=UPI00222581B1|nr:uncharacterized protein KGF54_004582 [Candida jiufengensis]KAI5951508.1 hypothetical protein KGF54_004582 [Candida jiufengensis]